MVEVDGPHVAAAGGETGVSPGMRGEATGSVGVDPWAGSELRDDSHASQARVSPKTSQS